MILRMESNEQLIHVTKLLIVLQLSQSSMQVTLVHCSPSQVVEIRDHLRNDVSDHGKVDGILEEPILREVDELEMSVHLLGARGLHNLLDQRSLLERKLTTSCTKTT